MLFDIQFLAYVYLLSLINSLVKIIIKIMKFASLVEYFRTTIFFLEIEITFSFMSLKPK